MSLLLDARRRAMLEEMGVKVWLPTPSSSRPSPPPAMERAGEEAEDVDAGTVAAPPEPKAGVRIAAPAPVAPAAPAVAAARPAAAAAAALRLAAPQRLYAAAGQADASAAGGGWLVVADMPPGADGRHGPPLAGDAGRLLDQMLKALRLPAGPAPVHLLRAHRPGPGAPAAGEDEADFDTAFAAWAAPLAPRIVLAMGPLSAQRLLGRGDPLGRLRGQAHALPALGEGVQVVATYHPAYLLRNPADKARAWADLCLAAACLDGTAAG